jgi:DnaK suppressor protein
MTQSRKDAITSLRQHLLKKRDALRKALEGDLSALRELHAESTRGNSVDMR